MNSVEIIDRPVINGVISYKDYKYAVRYNSEIDGFYIQCYNKHSGVYSKIGIGKENLCHAKNYLFELIKLYEKYSLGQSILIKDPVFFYKIEFKVVDIYWKVVRLGIYDEGNNKDKKLFYITLDNLERLLERLTLVQGLF